MARKKKSDLVEEPQPESRASGNRQAIKQALRFAGWTFGLVVGAFLAAWILFQGEQFLATDARFLLPRDGPSSSSDAIVVRGLKNASRAAVLHVFDNDRGRSIADLDPDRRRLQLRTVDWVRDASVRRVWPNHLTVDVLERQPVAFIQIPAGMSGNFANPVAYKPMLIDSDGVILKLRGAVPQSLPLLTGIRDTDDIEQRRERVLRMMRLLDDLRQHRDRISEVDVSDLESLRITYQLQDQQVILVIGNERYLERLNIFLRHYDGIRDRLPLRAVLDISLEGRITAVQPAEAPGK